MTRARGILELLERYRARGALGHDASALDTRAWSIPTMAPSSCLLTFTKEQVSRCFSCLEGGIHRAKQKELSRFDAR